MANNFVKGFLKYKDEDGLEKQVVAWVSDDSPIQHVPAGMILGPDFADSDQMIPVSVLRGPAGDGLAVVNIGQQITVGANANDAAITRDPVLIGGEAFQSVAAVTPLTDQRVARLGMTRDYRLITSPFAAPQDLLAGSAGPVALLNTSVTNLVLAPGANLRLVPLSVCVSNESAVPLAMNLMNGAAGATFDRIPCPAGSGFMRVYPGGKWNMSVNTTLAAQLSGTPTSSTVWVTVEAMISRLPA